jgi:hypothetical protein
MAISFHNFAVKARYHVLNIANNNIILLAAILHNRTNAYYIAIQRVFAPLIESLPNFENKMSP